MTRRERVILTLQHKESEKVPYEAGFTQQALENLRRAYGEDCLEGVCSYLHYRFYDGWPTELPGKPGYFRDAYGVVWNRSGADKDIGTVDNTVIGDLQRFALPAVDHGRLRADMEELVRTKGDRFTMAGISFSLFERAWTLCGFENVLVYMISEPEGLERLLDALCEYDLDVMETMLEYDIDGIHFGDDWGQQRGLIMGAAHWRRFIKPRMKRLYDRAHRAGKYVSQHSCGDCSEILGDMIDIGLDCYQTFQPEIYDIVQVKREYGDRLAFWGGISTQQLLPVADADIVRRETERIINIMRTGGGYIAAPTHAVTRDVPPENIRAMLDVFSRYGD